MTAQAFDPAQPFDLPPLPPEVDTRTTEILERVAAARTELGELKGLCRALPNAFILLSPTVIRESVASSRIENVNTTVQNALQMQLFPEAEQHGPDKEVLHYRDALMAGFQSMAEIPVSARTIHMVHETLLPDDAKGFRRQQNSIAEGPDGRARYTPPAAPDIDNLISNWLHYLHSGDEGTDPLVKCAIQHYQFEAIHPFPDGNGRTGRILMVLQLLHAGLLELPVLYISGYINNHRERYYDLLLSVSRDEAWQAWIMFMLDALSAQAAETKRTALAILELFESMRDRIRRKHPKIYSAELVEQLFSYPVVTPVNLARQLNMHYTTATRYLKALTASGLLRDAQVGKYHFYANHELIGLVQE